MKVLCLFSNAFNDIQKQRIIKKFARSPVSISADVMDAILASGMDKNTNAVLLYGLHEQDTDIIVNIRRRFKNLPLLAVGDLSRNARINVLQQGADFVVDHHTPPSRMIQILQALQTISAPQEATREVTIQNLRISLLTHDAWYQDIRLKLTRKEFLILRHLALHGGQTLSKDDLLSAIWDEDNQVNENSLEVLISRLRKKLLALDATPIIHTIYGVGYCLE